MRKIKRKMGRIDPSSPRGRMLGFTRDRFDGWLWEHPDRFIISFIVSKQPGQGHVRALIEKLVAEKTWVSIPTPINDAMYHIIDDMDFMREDEWFKEVGEMCEMYHLGKPPPIQPPR